MRRVRGTMVAAGIAILAAMAVPAAASAKLTADYRFEGNLKSSVGSVENLREVGPGIKFAKTKVFGQRQGVVSWPKGSGFRLNQAQQALDPKPGAYTFVMLVMLNATSSYRKLISFGDLTDDNGFYVQNGWLRPYPLGAISSTHKIAAGEWHQIALTRTTDGDLRAFVDGNRVLRTTDPSGTQVLGPSDFLRFVIDDEATQTEESGGQMARLRIYNAPLTDKAIGNLGH